MLTASVLSTLSQKPSLAATTNRSPASSALTLTSGSAVSPSAFRSASPSDLRRSHWHSPSRMVNAPCNPCCRQSMFRNECHSGDQDWHAAIATALASRVVADAKHLLVQGHRTIIITFKFLLIERRFVQQSEILSHHAPDWCPNIEGLLKWGADSNA